MKPGIETAAKAILAICKIYNHHNRFVIGQKRLQSGLAISMMIDEDRKTRHLILLDRYPINVSDVADCRKAFNIPSNLQLRQGHMINADTERLDNMAWITWTVTE